MAMSDDFKNAVSEHVDTEEKFKPIMDLVIASFTQLFQAATTPDDFYQLYRLIGCFRMEMDESLQHLNHVCIEVINGVQNADLDPATLFSLSIEARDFNDHDLADFVEAKLKLLESNQKPE